MLLHQLVEVSIGLSRGVEGGKSKTNRATTGRTQCGECGFGEGSASLLYVGLDTLLGALGSDDDIVAAILLGRPAEVALFTLCCGFGRSVCYLLFLTEELACYFDRRCESSLVVLLRLDLVPPREERKDRDDDGSCIAQRTLGEAPY